VLVAEDHMAGGWPDRRRPARRGFAVAATARRATPATQR